MDLQFDGFQHPYPIFWAIVLVLGVLVLSVWTYRNIEGLSPAFRSVLITLRILAFLLLLILLLNPVITLRDYITSPVRIALLLDNSQSTTIEKDHYDGIHRYKEVIDHLTPEASGRFEPLEIRPYGFDAELFSMNAPLEPDFEGSRTDIDRALSDFLDILDQEEAIIMVTDGIVTSGRDPSVTASRMPIPIYTVGIGDTTRRNDVVVQRVMHNPTASLNSRMIVETSILNDGFPDQEIEVQLRQEGTVLEDTTIRSSENRSVQQVRFDLMLEKEGLQQFQIHVPEVEGEWTTENNTQYFSIDVRDDRIRILHLAYEVHPDVRNIRSFLGEDQQISLENRTWITDDQYIEGALPDRPDTLDLVILHGFPHTDLSPSHAAEVADRFGENALFLIGLPGQDVLQLSSLFPGQMPIRFDSGFSWHDVQFQIASPHSNHAIMDFNIPETIRTRPIRGGIQYVAETGNTTSLLQSMYRGNETDAPLLAVRTVGNRNISHLNGYHFYRWALSTQDETRIFWENLLNNTVKWTATSPDEELLDISPSEFAFQTGEPVIINAFLRNESGEPEENAVIDLILENDDIEERRFIMSNEGSGRYQLEIGNLPEGSYSYRGTANREDREIDTRSGQFSIGGINREFINTLRDDDLLHLIAQTSGGSYFPHEQVDELFDILEEQIGFEKREETLTQTLALHRHPFWFVLVIVLLTTEWILRKYHTLA